MPRNKPTADSDSITPAEFARELRIDVHKVYKWIDGGELEAVDTSNRGASRKQYRITQDQKARFIALRSALNTIPGYKQPPRRRRRPVLVSDEIEYIK